ncbi:MAG TPA: IS1595 family transposase [Terriglobia bacterium]|jgi:transposase-like protein
MRELRTLQQAIVFFSDPKHCLDYLADMRWPDGIVICPTCGADDVSFIETRQMFQCKNKHPRKQFSIKVGTIMEDSPVGLDKWLLAMWMVTNCKNGVSSYEIHRAIGVTQKSAWFMNHRIRLAMQGDVVPEMGGEGETVEIDETYIGGLARNMHKDKRLKKFQEGALTGGAGKTAVFGLLERNTVTGKSKVHARVIPQQWKSEALEIIRETIKQGSNVYTDEHGTYRHLREEGFYHAFVAHAEKYVDGAVHTNGIENFWSLLKRGIKGTYVSVEPFHMFRYLDEQAFRFNERFGNDGERFEAVVKQIVNKRLTFDQLTGKQESQTAGF